MALSTSVIDRDQQAIEDKTMHYNKCLIDNDTKVCKFMFSELKSSSELSYLSRYSAPAQFKLYSGRGAPQGECHACWHDLTASKLCLEV
jgi:hypothetical protein